MEAGTGRLTASLRVAIAGSGNVASHLARALALSENCNLVAVASRKRENASALVARIGCEAQPCAYTDLLSYSPDVVIVSVADRAVAEVVAQTGHAGDGVLALHTSGTLDKSCLAPITARTGILYPFQTFTKGFDVDMREVPFFIETALDSDMELVGTVARAISEKVYSSDATRRRHLHIAGVFTSNFVNALLGVVDEELRAAGYPASVAEPLLRQTIEKASAIGSYEAQTGPAVRGDIAVMRSQISALAPEYREVYRSLSQLIMKKHDIANEQDKL